MLQRNGPLRQNEDPFLGDEHVQSLRNKGRGLYPVYTISHATAKLRNRQDCSENDHRKQMAKEIRRKRDLGYEVVLNCQCRKQIAVSIARTWYCAIW